MSTDAHSPYDDVLAKMDALLKRHHDRLEKTVVVETTLDFPVLTEEVPVEEDLIPVLTEVVPAEPPQPLEAPSAPEAQEFPFLLLEDPAAEPLPEHAQAEASHSLSSAALESLDQKVQDIFDQRLSAHIVSAMDRALATMLDQFSSQLESVVREAVAQELRKQLEELSSRSSDSSD